MVAEVVHGAPYRFADPARFSFAHGGKDRHPFPVPLKVYDETIRVLKSAVGKREARARGGARRAAAAGRSGAAAGAHATGPAVDALIAEERQRSHEYGGRSVFGWEPADTANRRRVTGQPGLGARSCDTRSTSSAGRNGFGRIAVAPNACAMPR